MPQYLMNIIQPDGVVPEPDFLEPIMRELKAFNDELRAAGAWVFSAGLHDAEHRHRRAPQDGETLLTDGPFVEAKEHVGGFTIVDAPDLDAALKWAGRYAEILHPLPIEVRPVHYTEEREC